VTANSGGFVRATSYRRFPFTLGSRCDYDEVVRSVGGSAAGRLTARRSWFQSARYRATRAARAAIVP